MSSPRRRRQLDVVVGGRSFSVSLGLDLVEGHESGAGCVDLGLVVFARRRAATDRRCGAARAHAAWKDRAAFRADRRILVQVVELRAAAHALALQAEFRFGHGCLPLCRDRASAPLVAGAGLVKWERFAGHPSTDNDRRSTLKWSNGCAGSRVTTRRAHVNEPARPMEPTGSVTCRTLISAGIAGVRRPGTPLKGRMRVPGDKSISHRVHDLRPARDRRDRGRRPAGRRRRAAHRRGLPGAWAPTITREARGPLARARRRHRRACRAGGARSISAMPAPARA